MAQIQSSVYLKKKTSFFKKVAQNKCLILLMIPGLLYYLIFHYAPMSGAVMAFTDYRGGTAHVDVPEAIGLYPSGRWLGESDKQANEENITYLRATYNRLVETTPRELTLTNGKPRIVSIDGELLL